MVGGLQTLAVAWVSGVRVGRSRWSRPEPVRNQCGRRFFVAVRMPVEGIKDGLVTLLVSGGQR